MNKIKELWYYIVNEEAYTISSMFMYVMVLIPYIKWEINFFIFILLCFWVMFLQKFLIKITNE